MPTSQDNIHPNEECQLSLAQTLYETVHPAVGQPHLVPIEDVVVVVVVVVV
eukprot:CAMPEP_0113865916 /NCGR_PEP_ID=MMETSP0372-20130328/18633_1 /TAXON_ID=340204 /ORGANISM="Lankesteria abbotti" /LENGTH=50 /DNA_ID=CAMNT_0000850233 /DNA_START=1 /DNA_END=150 /DNA_ORIENTATION=+ /assembly_acc=CAM_ASM_000359